jgi:zinc/manganese transport system substrate-binding protein
MLPVIRGVLALACLAVACPVHANLRILATTQDWGALARELGGEHVDVYIATSARQDVHRVEAKPSLIARARTANLIVATGAELEAGWLPVLVQESGNPRIQPGSPGYFEAAAQVPLLEVPSRLDRSLGDIHPQGNPHIHLDPRNIALVAKALAKRFAELDRVNAEAYERRANDFDSRWREAMARWEARAAPLEGESVVVIHRDQAYLTHWLGLNEVGAIEPKPGVPPSAGYLGQLVTRLSASPPKMILRNAYNDPKAVNWLSQRIHAPVVLLPYSVGGTEEAKDLFSLFDDTLDRLLAVPR